PGGGLDQGCGMPEVDSWPQSVESKSVTLIDGAVINVEFAGVVQFTLKSHISSRSPGAGGPEWISVSRWRMKTAGAWAGGGAAPSASAGVGAWKEKPGSGGMETRWKPAADPASIAPRFIAKIPGPPSFAVAT